MAGQATPAAPAGQPTPAAPAGQVAVVGIGCRFPGAASPEDFWELLRTGQQRVGEVPPDRWQPYRDRGAEHDVVLRRAITAGSFLADIDGFDADFFGVPPREAEAMDPQQRMLLEVTWEALEHAGIPPLGLAGTDAGVFVGVSTTDYGGRLLEDLPGLDAWTSIGAASSALANRISYALDLLGPSMAVDTACSASLVAVHLACQSLLLGESTVALAGGTNLLISPGQTVTLDAAGTLAPDGRSKSFDAAADGYGRGEGCGVLVLKRLADAERDGDPVLAVILGSAVHQDGRTNGIMVPCGASQEHVVRQAARRAGVPLDTVDYVEAHGTGTPVGDRTEAAALAATYGAGRPPGRPCLIGSVKANIGHLEGAAGVAGLVKAILALHHQAVPPTPLHSAPNPDIDWAGSGLRLAAEPAPWPADDQPRRAAVSSFGYGGTIGHVLLQEHPPRQGHVPQHAAATAAAPGTAAPGGPVVRVFPLSARSPAALSQRAADLADRLAGAAPDTDTGTGTGTDLDSLAHTLACRRSHLDQRAAVLAADTTQLTAGLRALAAGQPHPEVRTGEPGAPGPADPVWVFSGHGSQWAGMGRDLLRDEPAFREVIDTLAPVYAEEAGLSLPEVLRTGQLDGVDQIQMLIFAVQLGLAALWRSYGVRPAAVIGHSVGEIAAAVTAGILSPTDGARLICRRSRLLRKAAGAGAMAMVSLPFDAVRERLAGRTDLVAAVAAAPESTVVSGDATAVEAVLEQWPAEGIGVRRVASDVAFHSPHMEPLAGDLAAALGDLSPGTPVVPMYSTVLADPRAVPGADGPYWAANLRQPVRFCPAVQAAAQDGHRLFLEVSPHPVVVHSIREVLDAGDLGGFAGATLRRDCDGPAELRAALATAHCHGVAVDWRQAQPGGELVALPAYPWQHRRFWRDPSGAAGAAAGGHQVDSGTLLGAGTAVAGTRLRLWSTTLTDDCRPYPGSHQVLGGEVVPAAVLALTFLAAAGDGATGDGGGSGRDDGGGRQAALRELSMTVPLATAGRQEIQVVDDGELLRLAARPAGGDAPEWLVHATARPATAEAMPSRDGAAGSAQLRSADPGLVQQRAAQAGVVGTAFDWRVERLLVGDGAVRARVAVPHPAGAPATWGAVLDAAISIAPVALPGPPQLRMVDHADWLQATGEPPEVVLVEATATAEATVDVRVSTLGGPVVARLDGLHYPVVPQPEEPAGGEPSAQPLAVRDPEQLREQLVSEVTGVIATEMRLDPDVLDVRRSLAQQGLDSVMTVVVRRRLERRYGQVLPASLFWQEPSISGIAEHLCTLLTAPPAPDTERADA